MRLINFYQNALILDNSLICLVDDVDDTSTYGYTYSKEKVLYNINILGDAINKLEYDNLLSSSKNGLTTLYPLGQYIIILEMKKDKTEMQMYFLDFRVEYSVVVELFDGSFSENIKTKFKKIQSNMEEGHDEIFENILLRI